MPGENFYNRLREGEEMSFEEKVEVYMDLGARLSSIRFGTEKHLRQYRNNPHFCPLVVGEDRKRAIAVLEDNLGAIDEAKTRLRKERCR